MKRFVQSARALAAGVALAGLSAQHAGAQFAPVAAYPPAAPGYAAPTPGYAAPATGYPGYQGVPVYGAPAYANPRVAQATELPTPSEAVGAAAPAVATPSAVPATTMPYDGGYVAPTTHSSYPATAPTTAYTVAPTHAAPTTAGCATGNCATPAPMDYGATSCGAGPAIDYSAHACAVPAAPCKPRRQWFGGFYGLLLDRETDATKAAVAFCQDTATGGYVPGAGPGVNTYYPQAVGAGGTCDYLFTDSAESDSQWGAEIRFGSTFGADPCGCGQPFAWEVGYWGINDDSGQAVMRLDNPVYDAAAPAGYYADGSNNFRIYTLYNYNGLEMDLDGAGVGWDYRPVYDDNGMPASGNLDANDVRVLGIRVRQRFSAQNLELNFWRFGTPTVAPSCGLGGGGLLGGHVGARHGAGACGAGSCGTGCGPTACAPCKPPRRFFINGLLGVRYLRIDDDFGLDQQFTVVDTDPVSPTYQQPDPRMPGAYTSFPADDNSVLFSDFEANNELVGFQLGCSMNWLVGCRWNFFADSNFGIYGNNVDVNKRIYGGGESVVRFINGGGNTIVSGSQTTLATVGELRAGVGYQLGCHCRLTAAYRLIGVSGIALGADEFLTTNWSNAALASHINANNSLILHGLQTGVEFKY